MCVCASPARLTGTIVFLGKKYHPMHGEVFVLGYQNTAQNLSVSVENKEYTGYVYPYEPDINKDELSRATQNRDRINRVIVL
jgi:hypothetical protein